MMYLIQNIPHRRLVCPVFSCPKEVHFSIAEHLLLGFDICGNLFIQLRVNAGRTKHIPSRNTKSTGNLFLNYFITVGNKNITMNGKVVGDEWADIIRFRDWLKNDMQVRVVNLFIARPKIPYTDSGISTSWHQALPRRAGQSALFRIHHMF